MKLSEKWQKSIDNSNVQLTRREWNELMEDLRTLENSWQVWHASGDRDRLKSKIAELRESLRTMTEDRDRLLNERDTDKVEIKELRDKLIAAEKERDHWKANHDEQVRKNKILRERPDLTAERLEAYQAMEAELANANTAWAALNETHQKQAEKLAAAGNEIHDLRENLEMVAKLRDSATNELARYKSSDEAEQCETCEGTGKVETCAEYEFPGTPDKDCPDCTPKAVPLAPEDGPWVVMVGDPSRTIRVYWSGHADYYTRSTEDATKLATHDEASDAAREYRRKYGNEAWPVRLSDVAPAN